MSEKGCEVENNMDGTVLGCARMGCKSFVGYERS